MNTTQRARLLQRWSVVQEELIPGLGREVEGLTPKLEKLNPPSLTEPMEVESAVTIVVVNYNAGPLLEPCITLSLQQAGEVILVDNASTDESIEAVSRRFGKNPKLRVILNVTNLGFATACNIGANEASGALVLFLNPDCALEKGAVRQLRMALEQTPKAGMAGGLLLDENGKEQIGARRAVPTPWRSLVRTLKLSRFANRWPRLFSDFNLHTQTLPDNPIEVEAISGACTMVSRQAMQDVGVWDEMYFMHCEDLDLAMRYRQKGWLILFVPSARVVHHQGACGKSRSIFVEWHKHCGMMRFYKKFFRHQYPSVLMWLVSLGVWVRFCAVITLIELTRKRQKLIGKRNG